VQNLFCNTSTLPEQPLQLYIIVPVVCSECDIFVCSVCTGNWCIFIMCVMCAQGSGAYLVCVLCVHRVLVHI